MDEEETAAYRVPCSQCGKLDWGISEEDGRFFCKSCHNVIERTREVEDPSFYLASSQISSIKQTAKTKLSGESIQWGAVEGFQVVLRNQADALLSLGVHPHFKDKVLFSMWKLYLQKSRQAFVPNPETSLTFTAGAYVDSEEGMSSAISDSETDRESAAPSASCSDSDWSVSTSSMRMQTSAYRRNRWSMTMIRTLALIHLALVWSCEALTLSDLLRLVKDGVVPYVEAHQDFPEEMKLCQKHHLLFVVKKVPSHGNVHKEAQFLLRMLELPTSPSISDQSLQHPAMISVRLLMDANLPDDLHPWVLGLLDKTKMADQAFGVLPRYDLLAGAAIIVTMKQLFGLNDRTEWDLSSLVKQSGQQFSLRRWYRVVQPALNRVRQKDERDQARRQWKTDSFPSQEKRFVLKRKRMAEQIRTCFEKLSSSPAGVKNIQPSSFRFCWGDERECDGPSLHHQKLDVLLDRNQDLRNSSYWHPPLKSCSKTRKCRMHFPEMEPQLPCSFIWLLQLFSFLLGVENDYLYEEVLRVERRILWTKRGRSKKRARHSTSLS